MSKRAPIGRHRAKKPSDSYSNYVGRVGALAVALGVGMAIASSSATAWAGPDGQSSPTSSDGVAKASDTKTGRNKPWKVRKVESSAPTAPDTPETTPTATTTDPGSPSGGSKVGATGRAEIVRSFGGLLRNNPSSKGLPPVAPHAFGKGSAPTSADPDALGTDALLRPKLNTKLRKNFGLDSLPASTPSLTAAVVTPVATTLQSTAVERVAAAPTSPADFLTSVVTGVVNAFVNPVGTGSPQAPALPLQTFFGFLDALRREFERCLSCGTQAPTVTYDPGQTTQVHDVITGTLVVSGFDGTTPAFTATKPAHGVVSITPDADDPNTAHFTYLAGGDSTGTDSFNITVTDANAAQPGIVCTIIHLLSFGLLGNPPSVTQSITITGEVGQDGLPPGFERTAVVANLNQPTDLRFLPDGRILISEKGGNIRVFDANGQEQSGALMTLPVSTGWARGLLGIEVDPAFEENGYIYAAYITADNHDQLSRFTVADPTAEVLTVVAGSELSLMHGDQLAADDHHGGTVRFGPDGKLYWSTGDNGWNQNAPGVISQDSQKLSNIYGKIMRMNPDGSAPGDNPFVQTPGAVPQIYAYGFRNPYRFTFAPDGTMLVGDVGEGTWEELDNVVAGGNYGWPESRRPLQRRRIGELFDTVLVCQPDLLLRPQRTKFRDHGRGRL